MAEQPLSQNETVQLTIDGREVTVPKGTTVYQAARKLGIEIPIFCYQDRMPPFGACRVCLVEVEKANKLQASCTLEATNGMVVNTQSPNAINGRKGILELLLINHPLDCPICDRAGECPLQDQALRFGPEQSRFFEDKRRFKKPISLGPVLTLDRERCIICARCTRFGAEVAGDHALEFIERGYKTEVGTLNGSPPESKFIGNTIMLCPVGALTSQVYRFRARPWDNESTKSTCTLCPVGCSMNLDARDGEIMRTRSCENRHVNDIWLCDKGWFGYEFSSSPDRLQKPLMRRGGRLEPVGWDEAISFVAEKLLAFKQHGKLAAFGGNPITTEENYMLQKLMREGAGVNHVDHRIGMPIISMDDEGLTPGMNMSIGECEELSVAVLFGIDLTEEFPLIWLRLKQALNCGAKIIFIGNYAPEISKYFSKTIIHIPGDELKTIKQHLAEISDLLKSSKKSAFFVGSQYLNNPLRLQILNELDQIARSHPHVILNVLEGRGNSMGARFAGMRPDSGPLGHAILPPGMNALQVLHRCAKDGWDFLYVVGANPATKFPASLWEEARTKTKCLIVQDLFMTETAKQADVVLPTLSFVEKRGSFINIEGRVQKIQPGKHIPDDIYSDAEIFTWIAQKLGLSMAADHDFDQALKKEKVKISNSISKTNAEKENQHFKAGLRATFAYALFDRGVRMQHNEHVIELAKKAFVRLHSDECKKYDVANGDRIQISVNGNSIIAHVKEDDGVALGTAVLPLGFPEVPVYNLSDQLINGMGIKIERA